MTPRRLVGDPPRQKYNDGGDCSTTAGLMLLAVTLGAVLVVKVIRGLR